MPMIYRRFTDKTAEEWRQIYKVGLIGPVSVAEDMSDLMILERAGASTFGILSQKRIGTSC